MIKNIIRRIITCVCILAMLTGSIAGYSRPVQAGTTIIEPLYYNAELGCYTEKVTEYNEEYVEVVGRELTRKTVTEYYYLDSEKTVYIDYRVVEDRYIYDEVPSEPPAATASPISTPKPTPYGQIVPQYTPNPAASSPIGTTKPVQSPAVSTATPPVIELMGMSAPELKVNRTSDKKATIKWSVVNNASGYIIYRSTKEYSGYTKVKTIKSGLKTSYVNSGLKRSTTYYYKIKAYQNVYDKVNYTDISEPVQLVTLSVKKLQAKLKKLEKKYPDGMYWNHAGYRIRNGQDVSGFVTGRPCNHIGSITVNGHVLKNTSTTCNYYVYTLNGKSIIGYQCAGYACMISEKLRGKTKFRSHRSFSKANVGDCVRYSGHSALITEKHSDYIIVTECNYGNTCVIKWGRKIKKSRLKGAEYYTR